MSKAQRQDRAGLGTYLGRFLSGQHMDGRPRSDATFWRRGTDGPSGYWGRGRPGRWALAAGWQRAVVRLVLVAAAVGLADPRWRHVTSWALVLVGGPLAGLVIHRARVAFTRRRHVRQLTRPAAAALAPLLGVVPMVAEDSLKVVRGFEDTAGGEHVGTLILPDDWAAAPEQRQAVQRVLADRTGLDLKWHYQLARHPLSVSFTRAPVPPSEVLLADVLAELAAAAEHLVLLGRNPDGEMVAWDRAAEDPHLAVHGGSRRGKSSLLLLLAVQDLLRGGRVTAIDPKRVSLVALAGLPGVTLYNDPRDIGAAWSGVAAFRAMIDDRFEQLAADPTREFRRELLLLDEVTLFSALSAQLWRQTKEKSDPALPPVWDDLGMCVFTGAQVNAHAVVAGQRLDYRILGGMLGSFGGRLLAGYQPTDYARLVGLSPYQRSQKPRGRFLWYDGSDTQWLQLIYASPEDWRAYALERIQAARRGPELAAELSRGTPGQPPLIVGLAAAAVHLGMREDAFRKARQRRPVLGETSADGRPAWPAAALSAWRSPTSAGVGRE